VDTEKRKPAWLAAAHPDIRQSLLAVAIMATSAAVWGLSHWLPPASLPMLFVLGVLATALTTSLVPPSWPPCWASSPQSAVHRPLLLPERGQPQRSLTLFVLLIVGMTAGRLASRQRQQLIGCARLQQLANALLLPEPGLATASSPVECSQGSQAISPGGPAGVRPR
jgi:two-component system sensor histidine kinase KdpD